MPHFEEAHRRGRGDGDWFERVMQVAFTKHPDVWGSDRFTKVWRWEEWRQELVRRGEPDPGIDIGIDLVGELTDQFGGGLCAIQCKNYSRNRVSTAEVDKFLAASTNINTWSHRIFVVTTDFAPAALKKLNEAGNVALLTFNELDSWPVGDWRHLLVDPTNLTFHGERHAPRPHQEDVLAAIREQLFGEHPAGGKATVVMPCGTGKSVTALWAAEQNVGQGGRVLYLVPSLALMGQTMREWSAHRDPAHGVPRFFAVCSDNKAARVSEDIELSELAFPVTTNAAKLASELKPEEPESMTCVFSTYQSLDVVARAQDLGAPHFNLIICDEAHRTAGVDKPGTGGQPTTESLFTLVHNEQRVRGRHRLFMTATPRVYRESTKQKAMSTSVDLYSMDDTEVFGEQIYRLDFGDAIEQGLLSDYEVMVVAYDQFAATGVTDTGDLDSQTAAKLIGCWDALADPDTKGLAEGRPAGVVNPLRDIRPPLRRAIAFSNTIKASKAVGEEWEKCVTDVQQLAMAEYQAWERKCRAADQAGHTARIDVEHIDGTMNSWKRDRLLAWLRNGPHEGSARSREDWVHVLTNVRCLSEGVDVPALDAVLFLNPRQSEIEIVQAVGRVMRRAPDKEKGYVVLPILVPPGSSVLDPDLMNGSEWRPVWKVLNALRSHDNRMDGYLQSAKLTAKRLPMTVRDLTGKDEGAGAAGDVTEEAVQGVLNLRELPLQVASIVVEHIGDRKWWPRWGRQVKALLDHVTERVECVLTDPALALDEPFGTFADELRRAVRAPHLTHDQITEMLAQHLVTAPVLDALLRDADFVKSNPMSRALEGMAQLLLGDPSKPVHISTPDRRALRGTLKELESIQERMRTPLEGLEDPDDRLEALRNLFESFFQEAMPRQAAQLGVAYTIQPIVDFMLRSVDRVIKEDLRRQGGLGDPGVHVLDPFTGTGTFIYRTLTGTNSDGKPFIPDDVLATKYGANGNPELHANELLLLAYYVASLKIEEGYRERLELSSGGRPASGTTLFDGLALVDTFHTGYPLWASAETPLPFAHEGLDDNVDATWDTAQEPIIAIFGNPPWSSGQDFAYEDTAKISYPHIAKRVRDTYGQRANAMGSRTGTSAGNLYVLALRWATDQLTPECRLAVIADSPGFSDAKRRVAARSGGVVAFVHPNSLLDAPTLAGARAQLREEFDRIYLVDLRGNAYKQGAERKMEGDDIFDGSSRNGVLLTVAVRLPDHDRTGKAGEVRLTQSGDALSRKGKLQWLGELVDIKSPELKVVPFSERHDWLDLADDSFSKMMAVLSDGGDGERFAFAAHTLGVRTSVDTYVYDYSLEGAMAKAQSLATEFNATFHRVKHRSLNAQGTDGGDLSKLLDALVDEIDVTANVDKIKWSAKLKSTLKSALREYATSGGSVERSMTVHEADFRLCQYRPFQQKWLWWNTDVLAQPGTLDKLFPEPSSQGHRVTGSQGHRVTGSQGHRVTGSQGHRVTSSRPHRIDLSSQSSPSTEHQTYAQRAANSPAEQLPGTRTDFSLNPEPGWNTHDTLPAGLAPSRTGPSNEGDAARHDDSELTPGGAMCFTVKDNQIGFGLMACWRIINLHATGRATRALPRRR